MPVMPLFRRRTVHLPATVLATIIVALAACAPEPSTQEMAVPADGAAGAPDAATPGGAPAADATPATTPKQAMLDALSAFREARTFHADMQVEGGPQGTVTTEMQFVHPDRWRMDMRAGGQTIRTVRIGDDLWMDMDGTMQKVTMPPGSMDQWQDLVAGSEETMAVEFLGAEALDGRPARKYLLRQAEPEPSEVTVWIDAAGLPIQAIVEGETEGRATTTTIRYSRFNDPEIRIEPPA